MNPSLLLFKKENIDSIYELLETIYSSTDTMSELFIDKFPDINTCLLYINEILKLPGGIVLFAGIKNNLVGYITITPRHQSKIKHTSELNMGVHPDFRGQGIGQFLLNKALKKLKSGSLIEIVYLMVRADNVAAIKLYEKFSFEKIAVLEKDTKIDGVYYDGILMRKFIQRILL